MKKIVLLTCISLFYNLSENGGIVCQTKKTIPLILENQKIGYSAYNHILQSLNNLVKGYEFVDNDKNYVISVTPSVRKTGMKTIEGMESKKVGKGIVSLKIKNDATGLDTLIKREYSISGKSENETDTEIFQKLENDQQFFKSTSEILDHIFKSSLVDCKKNLVKVDELQSSEKFKEALILLLKIENSFSECKSNTQPLKEKITKSYEHTVCEKLLYEAKILINSGVEFQMNKAVGLLLQIPPSAACKDDAIKLSEELSAKMNLSKANSEKLINYQKMINQKNNELWYLSLMGG